MDSLPMPFIFNKRKLYKLYYRLAKKYSKKIKVSRLSLRKTLDLNNKGDSVEDNIIVRKQVS